MEQYLVPRDETARKIDPDGILDAPDSPGAASQSPSKFSRTSFSPGSNMGDGDGINSGSEYEDENMSTAAKMIVDKGSEHDSSMEQDEGDLI
jgi:hypothetical protein